MRNAIRLMLAGGVAFWALFATGVLQAQDEEPAPQASAAPGVDRVVVQRRPMLDRIERLRDDLVVIDEHLPGRQTAAHDALDRMRRELREIRAALRDAPADGAAMSGANDVSPRVMSDEDFGALRHSFKSATFVDPQVAVVRQAARYGWFTTAQVEQFMADAFNDDVRVEAAALIYPRVVDRERFHRVIDALDFGSSKEKLRKLIREIDERE